MAQPSADPPDRTPRKSSRRWCVPQALLSDPGEVLDAAHLLDEVRGPAGVLLWQTLRDVMLWAGTPADGREGLFAPEAAEKRRAALRAAALDPEVEVGLTALAALLAAPAHARSGVVAESCLGLARWLDGREAPGAAISLAQAAALVQPADPAPALIAGHLALRHGRHARAETWLRRAVGLARRAGDWDDYGTAYLLLGALHAERGNAATARTLYLRAARAGRRHAVLEVRTGALHGLFRLALVAGDLEAAELYARRALRVHAAEHAGFPALVRDVASLWIAQGRPHRALSLLRRFAPPQHRPTEHLTALLLRVRAAAAAGERAEYTTAWDEAWELLRHTADRRTELDAMLELAHAAAALGDWSRLEPAVRHAQRAATRSGDTAALDRTMPLLQRLRERG